MLGQVFNTENDYTTLPEGTNYLNAYHGILQPAQLFTEMEEALRLEKNKSSSRTNFHTAVKDLRDKFQTVWNILHSDFKYGAFNAATPDWESLKGKPLSCEKVAEAFTAAGIDQTTISTALGILRDGHNHNLVTDTAFDHIIFVAGELESFAIPIANAIRQRQELADALAKAEEEDTLNLAMA